MRKINLTNNSYIRIFLLVNNTCYNIYMEYKKMDNELKEITTARIYVKDWKNIKIIAAVEDISPLDAFTKVIEIALSNNVQLKFLTNVKLNKDVLNISER